MKTLKQWLDEFPEETRLFLARNIDFITFDSPTYYKQYDCSSIALDEYLEAQMNRRRWDRNKEVLLTKICANLILNNYQGLEDNAKAKLMQYCYDLSEGLFYYLPRDIAVPVYKAVHKLDSRTKLSLEQLLFITEDFDNLDLSKLDLERLEMRSELEPVLGKDICKQYFLQHPIAYKVKSAVDKDTLFDELFFGEGGWTEVQKADYIKRYYNGRIDMMSDFMERIVAVDKGYLKALGQIIAGDPAMADHLYYQKKSETELDDNQPVHMSFRYPREIRKLFQIAGCCARRNLPKTRAAKCGDIAAILKLYNYSFEAIFDAMYPQYIEIPEQVEEVEEQVV